MEENNALTRNESVNRVLESAPAAYRDNLASMRRCAEYGRSILDGIRAGGMSDSLDEQASRYIEKARRTLKAMNDRRAPVTKIFDEIRKEFTAMEAAVDPARTGSVPYMLQQERNAYAAGKRALEEERRRAALERQRAEQAVRMYDGDVQRNIREQFSGYLQKASSRLAGLEASVTLDNYGAVYDGIKRASEELWEGVFDNLEVSVAVPASMDPAQAEKIIWAAKRRLYPELAELYGTEIRRLKKDMLDRLSSKKANLERMAEAGAEEAARIKAMMERREKEEAALREEERRKAEQQERARSEMQRAQAEMRGLFDEQQQATVSSAAEKKVKVSKKIIILKADGILPVFMMWWSAEGSAMSVEDLTKMFRRQISYCEKAAEKREEFIKDANVTYSDVVKAR